ncbi:CLUMA_CG011434, isoform A [Clunio marinus]|uniref:CLUMA_CG011434, isoform A n=1 Tax=Clunio marinus TaxID=568069 RepID=A0A1J1IHY5_9DIPT|nr:CLUMA_CG011434, isoform A [Clunio marinus]
MPCGTLKEPQINITCRNVITHLVALHHTQESGLTNFKLILTIKPGKPSLKGLSSKRRLFGKYR